MKKIVLMMVALSLGVMTYAQRSRSLVNRKKPRNLKNLKRKPLTSMATR